MVKPYTASVLNFMSHPRAYRYRHHVTFVYTGSNFLLVSVTYNVQYKLPVLYLVLPRNGILLYYNFHNSVGFLLECWHGKCVYGSVSLENMLQESVLL